MSATTVLQPRQFSVPRLTAEADYDNRADTKWNTFVLKPPTHLELMRQPPRKPAPRTFTGNTVRTRDV